MAFYDVFIEGRYNRKLLKITNLYTAVYWSELLEIIEQVVRKHKFDDSGFFKLDRKYMEERTGIQLEEQLNCEALLEKLGVLTRDETEENRLQVRLKEMTEILADDKTNKLETSKAKEKISKAQAAANKKAAILVTMKRCCGPFESDTDLLAKYESWIDSVYSAGRFLTKEKIQLFIDGINKYSDNKDIKLEIINVGIMTGWDNVEWVINKYKGTSTKSQVKPQTGTIIAEPQRVATSVKEDLFF